MIDLTLRSYALCCFRDEIKDPKTKENVQKLSPKSRKKEKYNNLMGDFKLKMYIAFVNSLLRTPVTVQGKMLPNLVLFSCSRL